MVLPASDDRFDQKLVGWFAAHRGPWSGTASELLAAVKTRDSVGNERECFENILAAKKLVRNVHQLPKKLIEDLRSALETEEEIDSWPQSSRALYSHIESHRQILRSLGVDALLHHGCPRMVSLRSCQDEKPAENPPSGTSGINPTSEPRINPSALAYDQKSESADFNPVGPATDGTFSQDIAPAKSDVMTERLATSIYADGDNFEECIFESPEEALLAHVGMQVRIKEQGLDLKSAIESQLGDSLNGLVHPLTTPSPHTTDAETSLRKSATPDSMLLGLLASKLAAAPTQLWLAFKKACMRCGRVMGRRSSGSL
jgi:hypothetical protein